MPRRFDSPLPRREFLVGAGLAGAGLAGATLALPEAALARVATSQGIGDGSLRLSDPAENLRLYVKTNGDLSGKPYVGWYAGQVFAVEQGKLTAPLFGIEGFGLGWTRFGNDGKVRQGWKEVGFYKDLKTDEFIEQWRNPWNGEVCDVMHIHNRSVNFTMAPHFPDFVTYEAADPKTTMSDHPLDDDPKKPFVLRWFEHGDTVAVTMDSRLTGPNPLDPKEWPMESSGERVSVTEFFLQLTSRKELLDPKVTAASNVGQWTRICAWLPWMLMGRTPGQLVYRCVTKKLANGLEGLPAPLRAYTERNFAEFLVAPTEEDFKRPPESSWEVFKGERKPRRPKG